MCNFTPIVSTKNNILITVINFHPNFFNSKFSRLTIDSIAISEEPQFTNVSINITKGDGSGSTVLNICIDFNYEVSKITIQFSIAMPKDKNDKNYERVIIKTTVNACKMFQGVLGDFVVKTVMDTLRDSADFELKCPFPKVDSISNFCQISQIIVSFFVFLGNNQG